LANLSTSATSICCDGHEEDKLKDTKSWPKQISLRTKSHCSESSGGFQIVIVPL
jgi:hypothetical protein